MSIPGCLNSITKIKNRCNITNINITFRSRRADASLIAAFLIFLLPFFLRLVVFDHEARVPPRAYQFSLSLLFLELINLFGHSDKKFIDVGSTFGRN